MGNPISKKLQIGTLGELLVQIRLLEYDIQAAQPLKDSGNDLIAIKGEIVKYVQVKTKLKNGIFDLRGLPKIYHIVALVKLEFFEDKFYLDKSKVFLLTKAQIKGKRSISLSQLQDFELQDRISELWV